MDKERTAWEKSVFEAGRTHHIRPNAGHKDRFLKKLDGAEPARPVKRSLFFSLSVAATILVLVAVGAWLMLRTPVSTEQIADSRSLSEVSPELALAEQEWQQLLETRTTEAKQVVATNPQFAVFLDELDQLEREYEQLKVEFAGHDSNEQIMRAMIRNYRLRLEVLERMFFYHQTQNVKNKHS